MRVSSLVDHIPVQGLLGFLSFRLQSTWLVAESRSRVVSRGCLPPEPTALPAWP